MVNSPSISTISPQAFEDLVSVIGAVEDPEIPVLTIADLGVLRAVERVAEAVVVTITPTYSGCPAMHEIARNVEEILTTAGVPGEVRIVLSPAWTTDWMTSEGRNKLRDYGIAPPGPAQDSGLEIRASVACPQCGSANTAVLSEFGSTACKALYRCLSCLEPFDYFKAH